VYAATFGTPLVGAGPARRDCCAIRSSDLLYPGLYVDFLIKTELPEIKKEDVKVAVENGLLTIVGERKFEKEENKKYHRVERAYGRFVRSFVLPDGADAEKVNAEFKDGVLKVHLPKSEKTKPKQIEVKVA
jgi:HSP20 family protein